MLSKCHYVAFTCNDGLHKVVEVQVEKHIVAKNLSVPPVHAEYRIRSTPFFHRYYKNTSMYAISDKSSISLIERYIVCYGIVQDPNYI